MASTTPTTTPTTTATPTTTTTTANTGADLYSKGLKSATTTTIIAATSVTHTENAIKYLQEQLAHFEQLYDAFAKKVADVSFDANFQQMKQLRESSKTVKIKWEI